MAANSAGQVAARMRHVAEAAVKAQRISVERAARAMKDAHLAEMRRDAPSGKLSRFGKNGAKLNVRYQMRGSTDDPSAVIEAVGPWQILNNPAKPHEIRPRRKGQAILIGSGFRRSVHHPGHRGKQTWQRAQPKAARDATAELNKTMTRAVQEAFKG